MTESEIAAIEHEHQKRLEQRIEIATIVIGIMSILISMAAILNVSRSTLLRFLYSGELRGFKIPTNKGRWHISENALAEFIRAKEGAG